MTEIYIYSINYHQFPNPNVSVKMRKYVNMLTSLITEFNQHFQDFAAIEKDMNMFSNLSSVNVEGVQEDVQLELIEMQFSCLFGSTYIYEQTLSPMTLSKSRLNTKMTESPLQDLDLT